jgi:O-Antigen ligase
MILDNPALWLFAAMALPGALIAVRYWQGALFGVFVLVVFEGALRKWVFPWAQAQIYLVKDAILLAVYLGFILDSRRTILAARGIGAIKAILVVSFLFGALEVFNPNSPSVLVGLMGLKAYFLYAPVAFLLPYAFKSREHLFLLIKRYIVMAIPVAALGFLQIMAGPQSSLNTYVSHSEDAPALLARFGNEDLVRTAGTFSYVSGYTAFLGFIGFLAIGYNMAQGWRLKNNMKPLLALTLVVGAMFTTGSRAPVYTLLAASPVILWLAATNRVLPGRTAMRFIFLVPIMALIAVSVSPEAFQAFMERAAEADSTSMRIFSPIDQTMGALSNAPALGIGIGTTHPSALTIMGAELPWWISDDLLTEEEMARVTVELGLVGLLVTYLVRLLVAVFAVRCATSFKDPAYRALGIALAVHLTVGIITPIILNATAGLYYWGSLGVLLAMQRLEQSANSRAKSVPVRRSERAKSPQPIIATRRT